MRAGSHQRISGPSHRNSSHYGQSLLLSELAKVVTTYPKGRHRVKTLRGIYAVGESGVQRGDHSMPVPKTGVAMSVQPMPPGPAQEQRLTKNLLPWHQGSGGRPATQSQLQQAARCQQTAKTRRLLTGQEERPTNRAGNFQMEGGRASGGRANWCCDWDPKIPLGWPRTLASAVPLWSYFRKASV